ncbi:hypothetical protein BN946_scf184750.g11 [Trametes cinnabarina]|uniref:NYN domain-containing protein n=1 Tax=Pycnoporus cinnabarinus TaxID=5643 RepID=A0A060SQT3_PYCCI|nr:hypothetical protein BN946_scf184750.g11 [Trametes cinnabarina]
MTSTVVAVFWDYESCGLPAVEPTFAIVNKIRHLAHQYGSVKTFKAYIQTPEQSKLKSMTVRSELQTCGVSLVDCLRVGQRDVSDKIMMAVDMMAHAIDNSAPATIILISGDRDFTYPVSILSLRRYKFVLVAPRGVDMALRGQADAVYSWPADFLPDLSTASRSSSSTLAGTDERFVNKDSPFTLPNLGKEQQPTPPSSMSSRMLVDLAENQFFGRLASDSTSPTEPEPPNNHGPEKEATGILVPVGSTNPLRSASSATTPENVEAVSSRSIPASAPVVEEGEIAQSPSTVPPAPTPLRPPGLFSSWAPTATSTVWNAMSDVDPQSWSTAPPTSIWTMSERSSSQMARDWLPSGTSRPPTTAGASAIPQQKPSSSFGGYPASASSSRVPPRDLPTDEEEEDGEEWETYSHVAKKARPSSAPIPQEFQPLVKVLRQQISQGVFRVESSQLGTLLSAMGQSTAIYERAGATRLKEYTAKAAEAGVVKLSKPSPDGHHYIMLHPTHRKKRT